MSVRRKLFWAMASVIIAMSLIFVLITQFVVRASLDYMGLTDRHAEIGELSALFTEYYENNGGSWHNVERIRLDKAVFSAHRNASVMLLSPEWDQLYAAGDAVHEMIFRLGIRSAVESKGETVAYLYYYDEEVANVAKMRVGISSSVTFLLFASAIVIVIASLAVAFWLSKRLTAPLASLLPAIDRLGQGNLGIQVPVSAKDEYGKVAQSFNAMSYQLERAEEVRRNLVADVAHELRTPLTILRGHLDLIQHSGRAVDPEQLLPLQDELIRLTRLVDDLHLLSLAEARRLPFERKDTDVKKLLERVNDRIAVDTDRKEITVTMHCATDRTTVVIDPNRMTQVFLNLLVNAVRHTPAGGAIAIRLEEETASGKERDFLRISISDTGDGIDPEHLPYIFDRFYRTNEARTRNNGGMGLGLAIAKELVLAHQGMIEATSEPGRGSTFIVKLPF